jgi:hypothetical protein
VKEICALSRKLAKAKKMVVVVHSIFISRQRITVKEHFKKLCSLMTRREVTRINITIPE